MPETNFIHLNISLDDKLIRTVTYTKANSPLFPVAKRNKKVAKKQKNALKSKNDGIIHQNEAVVLGTDEAAIRFVTPATSSVVDKVVLTFTENNQVRIAVGTDYTGDKEIRAYLRLKYIKGTPEFHVGAKAKETTKKLRKNEIYDVPGRLAANSNPDRENSTWTFDTSRTDDGNLLIILNADDRTFPVAVFGHIVLGVIRHINDYQPMDLKRVGIRLPSEASIAEEDLSATSLRLDADLVLL
uniref:LAM_G_DOMAIN domain-containing protein n=1 Tax=Panagrellus redivivus TaxID=6233 RepID=A0A7E4ZR37_PANRE